MNEGTKFKKLKPGAKKLLVRALRSNEYEQTAEALCDDGGFCCLGVAYDVCIDGNWVHLVGDQWELDVPAEEDEEGMPVSTNLMLPPSVRKKLGMSREVAMELAMMNDDGCTFAEIADFIEQNL